MIHVPTKVLQQVHTQLMSTESRLADAIDRDMMNDQLWGDFVSACSARVNFEIYVINEIRNTEALTVALAA